MSDGTAILLCAAAALGFLAAAWAYEQMIQADATRAADALTRYEAAVAEVMAPEPLDQVDLSDLDAAITPADIPGCS